MILENIKNFDWYNDPKNVRFIEEGLLIEAAPQTDFWQNADCGFFKDNGHFFSSELEGDFIINAKWSFRTIKDSAQCGAMVRTDAANWIKVGLLSPNPYRPQIGTVVSSDGASDWSAVEIPSEITELYFRIRRKGKDFVVSYSVDGEKFEQIRMLHMRKVSSLMSVGAYCCSPKDESFECILEDIDVKNPA